ncbi:hypothetical protein [Actinoplanes sp. DH11]|uniref:hypothetical protein n=1 Tax=Actinoplanes sp. DH11 TaxID=2857011 RepID=UPI001E2EA58A|nr:hypothetical protein [Actinoplanes sp. DH11]
MRQMIKDVGTWILIVLQGVVAAAYFSGVLAFAVTDERSFPEHAPPLWAWPAVVATALGFLIGFVCVLTSVPLLARRSYRTHNRWWRVLAATTAADLVMLIVMISPPGWQIFDWYVS